LPEAGTRASQVDVTDRVVEGGVVPEDDVAAAAVTVEGVATGRRTLGAGYVAFDEQRVCSS